MEEKMTNMNELNTEALDQVTGGNLIEGRNVEKRILREAREREEEKQRQLADLRRRIDENQQRVAQETAEIEAKLKEALRPRHEEENM